MKVRIKVRPTGYVSFGGGQLQAWPKVGTVIELPDGVAKPLVENGTAEAVRFAKAEPIEPPVETRPAPVDDVETRKPVDVRKPTRPRKPE